MENLWLLCITPGTAPIGRVNLALGEGPLAKSYAEWCKRETERMIITRRARMTRVVGHSREALSAITASAVSASNLVRRGLGLRTRHMSRVLLLTRGRHPTTGQPGSSRVQ